MPDSTARDHLYRHVFVACQWAGRDGWAFVSLAVVGADSREFYLERDELPEREDGALPESYSLLLRGAHARPPADWATELVAFLSPYASPILAHGTCHRDLTLLGDLLAKAGPPGLEVEYRVDQYDLDAWFAQTPAARRAFAPDQARAHQMRHRLMRVVR